MTRPARTAVIPGHVGMIKTVSNGNDFLQLDEHALPGKWRSNPREFVRRACCPHDGMGADGLVLRRRVAPATYAFRVFNRDGGEAELSGNGMAGCAAVIFLFQTELDAVELRTAVGPRHITCAKKRFPFFDMTVEIGAADFANRRQFPFLDDRPGLYSHAGIDFMPVSVGNPHAVCVVARETSETEMMRTGQTLQICEIFPEGVNVEVVRPESEPGQWRGGFVERGVGVTRSSSTGCAAVFAALHRLGLAEKAIRVHTLAGAGSGIGVNGNLHVIRVENTTRIVYKVEYASID